MKNRLKVARELLCEDGSIWLNIDDNESHYLKILCDEIFGRDNFVTNICWQKIHSLKNDARLFSVNHDTILLYAKNIDRLKINLLPRTKNMDARYSNPDNDPRGSWQSGDLVANENRLNGNYMIVGPTGKKFNVPQNKHWVYSQENLEAMIAKNEIWFGKDGTAFPRKKRFLSEVQQGRTPDTWWLSEECGHNQEAKREILALKFKEFFANPKPERLLHRIELLTTNPNDLVLDFFPGSGTTVAVAHKMSRQYIGIEQMDYIEAIPVERLKKVIGKKIQKDGKIFEEIDYDAGGISKSVNWQGGGDFIYCELMKYNEAFMERIQNAKTSDELFKIWQEMAESSFLNWYVNPEMPEDAIKDFEAIGKEADGLEKQKHLLAELLDKNQLYVNLSEIDDAQFKVSEEDKRLNKEFCGDGL